MVKHNHKWLIKKSTNELERLYMEYNMIISRFRADSTGARRHVAKPRDVLKMYREAKTNRARILTILNQRRNQNLSKNGGIKHGIKSEEKSFRKDG